LDFSTRVYISAPDLEMFYKCRDILQSQDEKHSFVYWPSLPIDKGYWISPWADSQALADLFHDLKTRRDKSQLEVMLDLEFPKKKSQIIKRIFSFKRNKRTIEDFMMEAGSHNISITTVEKSYFPDSFLQAVGLAYPTEKFNNKRIKMFYTSFQRVAIPNFIVDSLFKRKAEKCSEQSLALGVGLLAPGIYGFEPTYSKETFYRELRVAKEAGVKEVVVFRLAGLDDEVISHLNENYAS